MVSVDGEGREVEGRRGGNREDQRVNVWHVSGERPLLLMTPSAVQPSALSVQRHDLDAQGTHWCTSGAVLTAGPYRGASPHGEPQRCRGTVTFAATGPLVLSQHSSPGEGCHWAQEVLVRVNGNRLQGAVAAIGRGAELGQIGDRRQSAPRVAELNRPTRPAQSRAAGRGLSPLFLFELFCELNR